MRLIRRVFGIGSRFGPIPKVLYRLALVGISTLLCAWLIFLALNTIFPFPEAALHRPPARLVQDRDGNTLRAFLAPDGQWRFPVTLGEVSPIMVQTLLRSEDQWFHFHPGVNPLAILRAVKDNLLTGRVVSGGSTIAMQVARLAEPRPRTLRSKLIEAFRALQLRWNHTPEEVLEFWLNMAPFGGNIVGVGAASRFYFDKTPDRLSLGEAALLTALPRAPNTYNPVRRPDAALNVRSRVLQRLTNDFPEKQREKARREPLPTRLTPLPMHAPHFARAALSHISGSQLRTSLDLHAQQLAEEVVRSHTSGLREQGLESLAVVALDSATREIRAMVGSPAFFDDEHSGQINGTLILRSPGSTLKPFLFAQAMDLGLTFPEALLFDIPTDYSGYAPENYDGAFRGAVTARYALSHSLNVPAVRLLARVGLDNFLALLRSGGLSGLNHPSSHYGLPLVLGGGEVSLLDLVNLYATLAQGGTHKSVRFAPIAKRERGKRLFSREACHLVTSMLAEVERPDMPGTWALTASAPEVAWKTGTSFGHRDAWAVGYSGRYTIGVWVGNLDGHATKGISGATHAGPVLFDLFRRLEDSAATLPEFAPLELSEVELCARSRKLPRTECRRITATILPGRTILEPDDWNVRIFIDDATGLRLDGGCLAGRDYHSEVIPQYPPALAAWRTETGLDVPQLPPMHPDCAIRPDAASLRIVSPDPGTPYHLRPDTPSRYQRIPLAADAPPDSGKLYWFLDGTLIGTTDQEQPFFLDPPATGKHKIAVQDDQGRWDSLHFTVE